MVALISKELRAAAAHSVMNIVRRRRTQQLPYRKILIDVADRLGSSMERSSLKISWPEDDELIEDYIKEQIDQRVSAILKKLPESERPKLQAKLVENLKRVRAPMTIRSLSVAAFAGVAVGAFDLLAGPKYSKTVPVVYRLILIRENAVARSSLEGDSR
jgi:uncharacterized protein YaaW (UPF0174 family)